MNDVTRADLRDRLGNIDQIRDILFGSQLREYSNRLDQTETSLSVLQQEIRDRTDELKQVFSTELQAAIESFDKRLKTAALKDEEEKSEIRQQLELLNKRVNSTADEVRLQLATEIQGAVDNLDKRLRSLSSKDDEEKADLRQQLDRMSKRLTANVERLDEALDKQTTSIRDDLFSSREKLQEDVLSLRTQIFEEMERRVSVLTGSKVSRDDMAEILFELGLRLKGTEFVPELREAGDGDGGVGFLLESQ